MKVKLIVGIIAVLVVLAIAVFVFYPEKGDIEVPKLTGGDSPELNIHGEADVIANIVQTDFSDSYNPFMIVEIASSSSEIVSTGDSIKIYLSGIEHRIKPECIEEEATTISVACSETDPNKIFEGWNSYDLQEGDKVDMHIREISVGNSEATFEAIDEDIRLFALN